MFQNVGVKLKPHHDPKDHPAVWRTKVHMALYDRKLSSSDSRVIGWESEQTRLTFCEDTKKNALQPRVESDTEV